MAEHRSDVIVALWTEDRLRWIYEEEDWSVPVPEIVTYLAYQAGSPVLEQELADKVCDDDTPYKKRHRLEGALALLTKRAKEYGIPGINRIWPFGGSGKQGYIMPLEVSERVLQIAIERQRRRGPTEPTDAGLTDPGRLGPALRQVLEVAQGSQSEVFEGKIGGQGLGLTPEQRTCIERYAMRRATVHYERNGWTVEDVSSSRPYDLRCTSPDRDELHVEVKGTTDDGTAVLLTAGEVKHAEDYPHVALWVLHNIELNTGRNGRLIASRGGLYLLWPWNINAHGSSDPTQYKYTLNLEREKNGKRLSP